MLWFVSSIKISARTDKEIGAEQREMGERFE
jgi:hypothetical protein